LIGREHGELDAFLRHEVEHAARDSSLRKPHAFRAAAEPVLEVGNAPADLGAGVAFIRERHDDVVVNLRKRGAVAAVARGAGFVGVLNHAIGAGSEIGEPAQECGAEVVAHARVVVEDAYDLALLVLNARGAVGRVALAGDALIPIVIRGCGVLHLNGFKPGVFARRLIEMAVDADVTRGRSGFRFLDCGANSRNMLTAHEDIRTLADGGGFQPK